MEKEIVSNLENFLLKKIKEGKFPLENNYGELFFSGQIKNKKIIQEILKEYLTREKNIPDFHWEFNNYILQELGVDSIKYQIYNFNQPFWKKVTNWILLRSLIYLKSTSFWNKIKGKLMVNFTLLINQKNGFLTDNRLYRKKEFSNQYHAFATALLGEIYLQTKNKFYKRRFIKAIKTLKQICNSINEFNTGGRGSKQIFGYSSAIYALKLGDKIMGIDPQKEINLLLKELKKFQRKDGSLPLCLTKQEFQFKEKDYKRNKKISGWESYNRYYDYLGFSYYFLKKGLQ